MDESSNASDGMQQPETSGEDAPRPRCRVCNRRLRSKPWRDLRIGPICARKNPELLAVIRNEIAGTERERALGAALDKATSVR